MKHIVCFSGGKDSTALVLRAKENLPEFTTVCGTVQVFYVRGDEW